MADHFGKLFLTESLATEFAALLRARVYLELADFKTVNSHKISMRQIVAIFLDMANFNH